MRELALTAGPVLLLTCALLLLAYRLLQPNPPDRVVLATGAAQGAYHEFGKRYAELLAAHGIQVVLRPTAGAAENIALLRDRSQAVDLALVQGGADEAGSGGDAEDSGLVCLGSLFHEPVWLFYRADAARRRLEADSLDNLADLRGWTLNVGASGSGSPNLMARLFEANRVDPKSMTLHQDPPTPAVVALLDAKIDALVFAAAPESVMVQMLLQTPGIQLFSFGQSEAYSRRFGFLSPVVLPRGVVDLARDQPSADVHLVAPTASLVARDTLHPALVQLFVQAARSVHGEAGWFQRKGEFPSPAHTEYPLAKEAERFYRSGPPLLQRYMPFWVANLVDRMWIALLSIVAIVIPLTRIVPPLYEFRIRSRVFRWYGELRSIEAGIGERPAAALAQELDAIERKVEGISVPLSYTDELYALRSHIQLVRTRLVAPA